MTYGITFGYYMGKFEHTYFVEQENGWRKIFFGKTEHDLEDCIREYANEKEKYEYYHKEKKYYDNLFEVLEDAK